MRASGAGSREAGPIVATIFVRRMLTTVSVAAGVALGAASAPTMPSMLGPSRPLPRVGSRAHIVHFGGGRERATVLAGGGEGRLLEVESEHGRMLRFALSRGSARYLAEGLAHGPRLELLEGS